MEIKLSDEDFECLAIVLEHRITDRGLGSPCKIQRGT